MRRALVLLLLTGCLDSIVDNPCEEGYALSDEGECEFVVEPEIVVPPEAEVQPNPPMPPPMVEPLPPGTVTPPIGPQQQAPDGLEPCPTCD
jgi:hypothetical protein